MRQTQYGAGAERPEESEKKYQNALDSLIDLNVKASGAGTVVELSVEAGDEISQGRRLRSYATRGHDFDRSVRPPPTLPKILFGAKR
jgi:hypothetical protein